MPGGLGGKTEAMKKSMRAAKNIHGKQAKLDGLVTWLVDHGVGKRTARSFLIRTGCDSLHSIAVWLRFQLPPLHLANVDCVYEEMKKQLGISGRKADAIIEELNVADCVNVDVNQEATMHLVHTGTLHNAPSHMDSYNGHSSRMNSEVVPEPRSYAGRRSSRAMHRQHSHGRPNSNEPPRSWGAPPSPPGSYNNYTPPDHGMQRLSPNPSPRGGRGTSPSRYGQYPPQQQPQSPQYTIYNNMLEGNNANAMQQPNRSGQPWIMVSQNSNQGSVPASPRANFNNGLPGEHVSPRRGGGDHYYQNHPHQPQGHHRQQQGYHQGHQQHRGHNQASNYHKGRGGHYQGKPYPDQQSNRSRGRGRGVGEGSEDVCMEDMHAEQLGTRGAQAVCEGANNGSSSADLVMSVGIPPQRPIGEGVNPYQSPPRQQDAQRPVAEGAAPHYLSPTGGGLSYIEENMSSMTGNSGLDLAPPPPQRQSFMWGTGGHVGGGHSDAIASRDLPGVPTVSKPLDPGAYHQANVMLRKQMPHYIAKVSVNFHWDHVIVWVLTILAVVSYIGVRIWYLVTGKSKTLGQDGVNIPYSWMTLIAEGALASLGIYLHQNFWKQEVAFTEMPPHAMDKMYKAVKQRGMSQTVHVLIATYTEPAVTVRECVLRLLVAPEPVYMEKMIYVCDDGHAKSEGPKKKAMVEELRVLGHMNVFYVGDRVKKPDQLNGKSANLNHVLLHKIYPTVKRADQVPLKDIFMVMDCDHMVKPDIFNKMGPCMLNDRTAVCLVPQCFHNTIHPDALDAANGDFMFGKLPFYFGAGVLFVTGTNVMVRCRSAFEVCKYADANAEASEDGEDHRQLFTVDEISEDVVLGSRLHAAGFKGVFVAENLATGEVPLEARAMWRQRFRWFKGGHLFLLSPTSVFFEKHRHMTFYQKTLYWICLVANVLSIYADPVLMAMPFLCLVLGICVYGLDDLLFWTHFVNTIVLQVGGAYYTDWNRVKDSLKAHVAFKVLWFTTVKACINTVMVMSGWKKSGVFKATPKLGEKVEDMGNSQALPDAGSSDGGRASDSNKSTKKGFELHQIHDALSKVTEVRKKFMPYDGTLDFWVLMGITLITIFALAMGIRDLIKANAIYNFKLDNQSLKWLAIVWALHQTMPGVIFAGYLLTWNSCPGFLKFYVPFVTVAIFVSLFFIEFRIAYAFLFEF